MFGNWLSKRSRAPEVLVVSVDRSLLATVQEALGDAVHVRCVMDVEEALTLLASRPVLGAIVDGGLPGSAARMITRAFLRHQPIGNVAIVSSGSADDASTLVAMSHLDPRVDMLFRPLDTMALVDHVLGREVAVGV